MKFEYIIKRNGKRERVDIDKLRKGVATAFRNSGTPEEAIDSKTSEVLDKFSKVFSRLGCSCVTAETVQNLLGEVMQNSKDPHSRKAYRCFMDYAIKRRDTRDMKALQETLTKLSTEASKDMDLKRENANINADTAMGSMLKYGSESAKSIALSKLMPEDIATAHREGDIHIHDLDFWNLTETCCQINLAKLFKEGFSTGHGFLREPGGIGSAASLTCIAIQSNQNDQHGGQSIPCFDYYLAPYVTKTMVKRVMSQLADWFDDEDCSNTHSSLKNIKERIQELLAEGYSLFKPEDLDVFYKAVEAASPCMPESNKRRHLIKLFSRAQQYTEQDTYQAMEALVGNLNTMSSRAGAQVPFSSLNFGTDISPEGRCVSRNLLKAVYEGLGNGETPIFPITIFKVKSGVNFEPDTPNYDLYQQALRTTAKRLFPNFSFIDAKHNLQYYKSGHPETEVAYMGCRTRVIGNVYDNSREITEGRGNLSFTTINLPRLGILCNKNISRFYQLLDERMELVRKQLLARFDVQSNKYALNYPFLMGQGVWIDSEKLYPTDKVGDILRHGTLSIGFIGLAECLTAILGKHHGESSEAQQFGLEIVRHMRAYTDKLSEETQLNWSVVATPAEGLSGRFVRMDKERFGVIPGVTDKDWYTNSFHIPVEFKISAFKKIQLEGPYHELTNGGHITYVELDGDASGNIQALDKIVHCMYDSGIGYGAINHPVDRDPVCGYLGVIGDTCPLCQRTEGEMADETMLRSLIHIPSKHSLTPQERGMCVKFERIRRITGYLVGTLDRFNDAKRAETESRVKHL